ncbi:MAG: hypothetical protein BWY49_01137 [Candidatus Omnitrophica bacterium ADurb.Bin314]|nr:MAG: hypothetical protein BWY49_01137 [Candidatus Omnitrophica bacterium ADurb.Bin314]
MLSARRVFFERSVAPVRNLIHRQTGRETRRHHCDRESRSLRRQRRGTRRSRVNLDYNHAPILFIVGELNIRSADHTDRVHNLVGIFLQFLLDFGGDRQHRRHAEAVARVDTHRVHILDKADRNLLIFRVADHFQFKLFPSDHSLLDQNLTGKTDCQPTKSDHTQILDVIGDPAAGTAHRIGRTDHDRIAELLRDRFTFLDGIRRRGPRHGNPDLRHGRLEDLTILPALDRVRFNTDDLDTVFFENTAFVERRGKIQARLPSEIGQQRIGTLFRDDLFEAFDGQRFDVGMVRHFGIGHDGRRVRVHEHDLIPFLAQGFAGLRSGIIEFTRLTDDDRPGPDNQDFLDVITFWHDLPLSSER